MVRVALATYPIQLESGKIERESRLARKIRSHQKWEKGREGETGRRGIPGHAFWTWVGDYRA